MIDYMYKDGLYIGTEYLFDSDNEYNMWGKVSVVSEFSLQKYIGSWYIFRTWINFNGSFEEYNKFGKSLIELTRKLPLKLVRKVVRGRCLNVNCPFTPDDPFLQPIFYERVEKMDVGSFSKFMNKIEFIAGMDFTLYCPTEMGDDRYT